VTICRPCRDTRGTEKDCTRRILQEISSGRFRKEIPTISTTNGHCGSERKRAEWERNKVTPLSFS
jgi:hypothetical protein